MVVTIIIHLKALIGHIAFAIGIAQETCVKYKEGKVHSVWIKWGRSKKW